MTIGEETAAQPNPISQEDYEKETILTAINEWESLNGDSGIKQTVPERGYYYRYLPFIKIVFAVETVLLLALVGIILFH